MLTTFRPMRLAASAFTAAALLTPIVTAAVTVATPTAAEARSKKKSADDEEAGTKIKKGTEVTIVLDDPLSSGENTDGDTFTASVKTGFLFGDKRLKGYTVEGHVEGIKKAGMGGKKGEIDIVFDELVSPKGNSYPIEATLTEVPKAESKMFRNAGIILAGAVAGHHIGKKTDKKHGALLGGASAVAVALTLPGGDVVLKKKTKLKLRLDKSVTVD